ncbi:hypothetical protein N0V82_004149 [Gnomoniopsis sp. IMI 355080]|nr:hypothetical protein N0V82_004149 [Gnomoniopsis sp. IMI 355080]
MSMLTLVNLAVALAGAMLWGGVAAAPAPRMPMPTTLAIVPIITATETYIDGHGSLTTATITISKFTANLSENIVVYTSSPVKDIRASIPKPANLNSVHHKHSDSSTPAPGELDSQAPTHGLPSSAFIGIPVYTHNASRSEPSVSQGPGRLIAEVARNIDFTSYCSLPTPSPTRHFTGMPPHETTKPHKKPSVSNFDVLITKSDIKVTHTVGSEGVNNE